MLEINSSDAKVQFSDLMRRVKQGEEFIILSHGSPAAKLVPVTPKHSQEHLDELKSFFRGFRADVAESGLVLRPGETWRDLAHEGHKW